jgi:hypothetical protein
VFERFCAIDLHPNQVSNIEMGYLFEDLIRRFSEISNETAGEHFTPREVIRLIVELLLANDHAALTGTGIIRTEQMGQAGSSALAIHLSPDLVQIRKNSLQIPCEQGI